VARIAYDDLTSNAPNALSQTNDVLAILKESDPSLVKKENTYPFVECATLADDIKSEGGAW
jgi:hypothetical protein